MNTKEYFGQAFMLNKRINSKLDHLAALRELVTKATTTISDMPPRDSREVHQLEEVICRIVDLEKEVNADIVRFLDLKEQYTSIIRKIKNPLHQLILEQRYLCCHPWERIATELEYEPRSLYRLHSEALMAAEEHLQKIIFDSSPIVIK